MNKIAIVIFSNLEGSGQSAVYRAMMFAEELHAAGDDVSITFDGGGTAALAGILKPDNRLHRQWEKVATLLRGACGYCARSYGVEDDLKAAGIPFLTDHKGHASLRALLAEGRQIVTF
jgi:hypothetical protein